MSLALLVPGLRMGGGNNEAPAGDGDLPFKTIQGAGR